MPLPPNFGLFEKGFHPVAQVGLELIVIHLPQLFKYWSYRCEPYHLANVLIFFTTKFMCNLQFFKDFLEAH